MAEGDFGRSRTEETEPERRLPLDEPGIRRRDTRLISLGDNPALLESIVETSPVGIVVLDRDGSIVFANTKAESILGLTRSSIAERTYNDPQCRITAFDGSAFPDDELPFARVNRTGKPVSGVRHAIQSPDGKRVYLSIDAAPLLDGEGTIQGMVGSLHDITEQVKSSERLRASEEGFRNIVQSSPMGMHMYRLDPDDRLVFLGANPAADKILGVKNEQFIGKTIEEAFPPLAQTEIPHRYRRGIR